MDQSNGPEEEKKMAHNDINQDDYFYKIKELNPQKLQYIIEIPKLKKKYKIQFNKESEFGFIGLPLEWERFIREMQIENREIEKSPFEFLMTINFCATAGFAKMLNKSTLYERMGRICD